MDGLLVIGALLCGGSFALVALAVPHVIEGVVHLYLPTAAFVTPIVLGSRVVAAGTDPETTIEADGYREVRRVELPPPTLQPGIWVVGPGDAPHSRIYVIGDRTARISILAPPGGFWPFRSIPRALATVNVRCVETKFGRELEARCLPACLAAALSIPVYGVLIALWNRSPILLPMLEFCAVAALFVFGVFTPIWWMLHSREIRERTENALEVLENQLRRSA